MKIFVAADHRGFESKNDIIAYLKDRGYNVEDDSAKSLNPDDDFPVFAGRAVHKVLSSEDDDARAILICGTGQGMVMAANRFRGIRAGFGWSRQAAKVMRNDEDANIIAISAEMYQHDQVLIENIIEDFLTTPFAAAPRFIRRNAELDSL